MSIWSSKEVEVYTSPGVKGILVARRRECCVHTIVLPPAAIKAIVDFASKRAAEAARPQKGESE